MANEEDPRITAPVPSQWRRRNPLPQPVVVVNTFNEAEYDQQLEAIEAVTTRIRNRVRVQTTRFVDMDAFFQLLIPRIRHVLSEMTATHERELEEVAQIFQAALIVAQTERDRIAVRARASAAQAYTLTQMQENYLNRLDQFISTLDGDFAQNLKALLWDEDVEEEMQVVASVPRYPSDGEGSPDTIASYATIDDVRHFVIAWNVLLREARERAANANISVMQYLRNQRQLFNRDSEEQREADFDAVLRAFTSVYNVEETIENVEALMQETPAAVLRDCPHEQLYNHPRGLVITDDQGACHDLIAFAESVAARGGRAPFIRLAGNIVIGYNLFARLLEGPNNMHVRFGFADAITRQYELPQTRNRAPT